MNARQGLAPASPCTLIVFGASGDLTKRLLTEVPLEIRNEPMESESFSQYIRGQNNLWIYASNITEFHYFDLDMDDTSNAVVLQIIYPNELQLLDLAPLAGGPVKVHFEIPLRAERVQVRPERVDAR